MVYELVRGEGDNTCKVAGEVINVDEVETDSETDNEDEAEFPDLREAKRVSKAEARERKRQEESGSEKEAEVCMSFRNTNDDNIVADLSWMSKKHLRERSRKRHSRKKRVPKKRSRNESIAGRLRRVRDANKKILSSQPQEPSEEEGDTPGDNSASDCGAMGSSCSHSSDDEEILGTTGSKEVERLKSFDVNF